MAFIDFEYAGQFLSDFGFMVCDFSSNDMNTISNGSTLTLNTVPMNNGAKFLLTSSKYDECVSATFSICKNVCDYKDLSINVEENSKLMRWLNRKTFHKFKIVDDDYSDIYFNSTFNVSRVVINGKLIGYELQMLTDSPFGYKEPVEYTFSVLNNEDFKIIIDTSDEVGFMYPDMKITLLQDGDLIITNEIENRNTIIKGCSQYETITMNYPIIQSDVGDHNIMNSFNFDFFRITNTYEERVNKILFSLPCEVTLSYSPIRKVVV